MDFKVKRQGQMKYKHSLAATFQYLTILYKRAWEIMDIITLTLNHKRKPQLKLKLNLNLLD